MRASNSGNLVWLQMRTIFGRRGIRGVWMGAAVFLFLKGCDGFLQMTTRFDRSLSETPAVSMARMFTVVLLLSFIGILLSLAVGSFIVDTDLRKRFVLNLFATPLTREEYIVGKWLGALAVFATYWAFCALSFCMIMGISPTRLGGKHAWVLAALAATMLLNFAIASFLSLWIHPFGAFVGTFAVLGSSRFLLVLLALWGDKWWAIFLKAILYLLPSPSRQNPVAYAMRLVPFSEMAMGAVPGMEPDPIVFLHNLSYAGLLMWFSWVILRRRSFRA